MTTPDPKALIEKLESYYDFECTGGPLKNCVDWEALKTALSLATALQVQERMREALAPMDTRTGKIYDSYEDAKAAGVPDEFLVTGTREALEKLKPRIKFTKGSFKNVSPKADADATPR